MADRIDTIPLLEQDESTAVPMFEGKQIVNAPQPSLTAADATAITTSGGTSTHIDSTAQPVLDNMRTRINEIEAALKSLGLLK